MDVLRPERMITYLDDTHGSLRRQRGLTLAPHITHHHPQQPRITPWLTHSPAQVCTCFWRQVLPETNIV